ncbi:MAG: ABC-type nitrate/sulfonate/bicarbonate transport system ATPase subunit [Bacteroidia bacterium]|jgi:ABC-type nitrate/sulfonate/bicarbonate transport system ATPase subunit
MPVSINDVAFRYGKSTILDGVDVKIQDGEIVALLGVSGSGKSTLFNLISGLFEPSNGSVELSGFSKRDISYIRQSAMDMVFPWKTVSQNAEFALKERGELNEASKQRLSRILRILKLDGKLQNLPSQLSGGELKRLSFACGLSYSPKLVLLDEAFTGIDFSLKWELWACLKSELTILGATAVIATHDFDEAIFLSDRIIFLNPSKQIDGCEILVEKTDDVDIGTSLSTQSFIRTKERTLKAYKKVNAQA